MFSKEMTQQKSSADENMLKKKWEEVSIYLIPPISINL